MYNISLVYFSPTGSTSRILKEITAGLSMPVVQNIDLTRPETREYKEHIIVGDILLLGVPVYKRTVPGVVRSVISKLQIKGKYIILVAVYGGISAGNALKDLSEMIDLHNNRLFAAAEFVSSHSFLLQDIPESYYRPDELDIGTARDFGYRMRNILESREKSGNKLFREKQDISLPKNKKKKIADLLPKRSPGKQISIKRNTEKQCRHCLLCVNCCPVTAINAVSFTIDTDKCFNCSACVQKCPQQVWYTVRSRKLSLFLLKESESDRKFPRIYI